MTNMSRHPRPVIFSSALILVFLGIAQAGNQEYWWMDDQSLFEPSSGGGQGGNNFQNQQPQTHSNNGNNQHSSGGWNNNNQGSQGSNNNRQTGGWDKPQASNTNHQTVVDPQPLRTPAPRRKPAQNAGCGGYGGGSCGGSLPAPSPPVNEAPVVQTECPSGSKCVAEDFCDSNGVMSNTRVSLSHNQKEQRGQMIPCMINQNRGTWGICCAIPPPRQPANNNYPGNNNQFAQNQPQQPAPRPNNPEHAPKPALLKRPHEKNPRTLITFPAVPLSVFPSINPDRRPTPDIVFEGTNPTDNGIVDDYDYHSFSSQLNNGPSVQQQPTNTVGGGNCPNVANLPPVEACAGRASNCWSVGQPDVDCPGNALCCFDGCANTCQGGGGTSPRQPTQSSPRQPNVNQAQAPASNQQQFSQAKPNRNKVSQSKPSQGSPPRKHQTQTQIQKSYPAVPSKPQQPYPNMQQGANGRPSQQGRPQNKPRQPSRPKQQPRPQSRPRVDAEQRPSVMCPAAMLCVAKPNCDFKGIITDIPLNNLTPELEALRVPYIPCVNPQNPADASTVCCRDPNYVDPWPNMNGGNGGGKKNMNRGNNRQKNNKQNGGGGNSISSYARSGLGNNNQQQQNTQNQQY